MKYKNDARIEIVEYDDNWPTKFLAERDFLLPLLAPWLSGEIAHIGSTAVPGLAAKPIIDVMAPVVSLLECQPAIELLSRSGYCYYPYRAESMHWFCKPSPQFRTHHLHLVPANSELWHERLLFRDALRASPLLTAEYAQLKRELALRFSHDRERYTDEKSDFINRVITNNRR